MKRITATLITTALCAPAVGAPATGSLTAGIGNLELGAPSAKHGEYSGLGDDTVIFLGKLNLGWREQAHYLNVDATDIGNDTLHMGLRGGVSQALRIDLNHDQIPHLISRNARSPYGGIQSASLTLPAGFVPAATTAGMTTLTSSLNDVEVETERKHTKLAIRRRLNGKWAALFDIDQKTKSGLQPLGAAVGQNGGLVDGVILPAPIDYQQTELGFGLSYQTEKLQLQLRYTASEFENEHAALRWDVPFLKASPSADTYPTTAQTSLPADNTMNRISLSAGYAINSYSRLSWVLEQSTLDQDVTLLPYTINPAIALTSDLPRTRAAAEMDVTHATFNFTTQPLSALWLNARYRRYATDNQTPQSLFLRVTNDTTAQATAASETATYNAPYDSINESATLTGRYYYDADTNVELRYGNEQIARSHRAAKETDEDTYRMTLTRAFGEVETRVYALQARRDAGPYNAYAIFDQHHTTDYLATVADDVEFDNNPLVRQFDLSDRERAGFGVQVRRPFGPNTDVTFNYDRVDDRYTASGLGIKAAESITYTLDVTHALSTRSTCYGYVTREEYETQLNGRHFTNTNKVAQSLDPARNWFHDIADDIDTFGLGSTWRTEELPLKLSLELIHTEAQDHIDTRVGSALDNASTNSDDLRDNDKENSRRNFVKLDGAYELSAALVWNAGILYERLKTSDWQTNRIAGGSTVINDILPLTGPVENYEAFLIYTTFTLHML